MKAPVDGRAGDAAAPMPANQSTVDSREDQTRTSSSVVHELPTLASDNATLICNLTELGNAKRLVARFGIHIRYVPTGKKWLVWDGRRWAFDPTGEVHRYAKKTIKLIYAEAANAAPEELRKALADHANRSEAAARIRAMIELASTEPGIPVLPDQLDTDPWALTVLNGTLDLRTGKLLPHRREDLITKLAPVEYDSTAQCPMFMSFLAQITGGDEELQQFLQRAIGYGLTGDTSEQVMFTAYGTGANGKSTLLNIIQDLLGDYALQTPTDTFVRKRDRSATNDLARLRGARFVVATEVDDDGKLDEVLVKQATGGDKISARFLYKEFFDFRPECKIFLVTNYKPDITGSDQGIWRRIILIPFEVMIPEAERDKHLTGKLRTELPGILAWAVEGCLAWQREGLNPPERVRAATSMYREEMDWMSAFLAERCLLGEGAKTSAADLYTALGLWWSSDDEQPSQKEFGGRLRASGLQWFKKSGKRWWAGIAIGSKDH